MTTLELEHYVHRKLRFEIDLPVGLQTRRELWQTRPTNVFRALCEIVPYDHEVAA